jgi:hypothetical protein
LVQLLDTGLKGLESVFDVTHQQLPGGGQAQAPGLPHKQGIAEVVLQVFDLPADGALCDVQVLGRGAETACAGGGQEKTQSVE